MEEVKNYKRQELFDHYDSKDDPFLIISVKVDVTNIYNYCKKNKNHYATMGYVIGLVVNEMDCFKYRKIDNKIYKHDKLNMNYTQMINDDEIGFFPCDFTKNFNKYIKNYKKAEEKLLKEGKSLSSSDQSEIWLSCAPWFSFNNLVSPYDKSITVPQIIWDKYVLENNRVYTNVYVLIHHGFADGSHMGKFYENLNIKIENFEKIIKEA